jgi:hypothetical protein
MKMNLRSLALPAIMIAGMGWLASCQKDNSVASAPETIETAVAASGDEAVEEAVSDEIFNDVAGIDDATAGEDLGLYGLNGGGIFFNEAVGGGTEALNEPRTRCYTVTVSPMERGVFPKTVTIDFGSGCEVRGHLRKGKIIIVYSGRLHRPGSSAVTKFENFYIDQFRVEGEHTVKNITTPGSNYRVFTRQTVDGKITNTEKGTWCTWNVFHTIKQVEGNGTPFFPRDDVFSITGAKNVACSNGKTRTAEIVNPLIRRFGCKWIVQGTVNLSLSGTVGSLDFGDGTCDNTATITVNGENRTITLR